MVTDDELEVATKVFLQIFLVDDNTGKNALHAALEAVDAHREEKHKAYLQNIRDEILKDA